MAGSEQTIDNPFILVGLTGGKDANPGAAPKLPRTPLTELDSESLWRKAASAIEEAARNRGREANALKSVHEFLEALKTTDQGDIELLAVIERTLVHLSKLKDWDKPQWFKTQPASLRDDEGRPVSEHQLMQQKNRIADELMSKWDLWAADASLPFVRSSGSARQQLFALDDYIVRRVALDSLKNWLRRRPSEQFINDMFAALALNKIYLDTPLLRLRCLKDESGQVRGVEIRDGQLFFEQSEDLVPLHEDEKGRFVELPDDSDMIVFERRMLFGERVVVPVSQPNGRDPNIQWFNGGAVKRGWQKEQRFFSGPQSLNLKELYGFFPDHFPMRLTNSQENRMPTEKVGGAIYGYAREHAGRQSRHLIAEFGIVMPSLKRNNSQLINDARQLFGLQRPASMSAGVL